jgi:hypothetical protein
MGAVFLIGIPLAVLIFLSARMVSRPIELEQAADIAGVTIGGLKVLPALVFLLAFPACLVLLALAPLAWVLGFTSVFDGLPIWHGMPVAVWGGAALLGSAAAANWHGFRGWLRARKDRA